MFQCVIKIIIGLLISTHASSAKSSYVSDFLNNFKNNPKAVMNEDLPKFDNLGREVRVESKFSIKNIQNRAFIDRKIYDRNRKIQYRSLDRDGFESSGDPTWKIRNFVESNSLLTKIQIMDSNGFKSGKIQGSPWSDDYWPVYKGILGARYADRSFNLLFSWRESADYIINYPMKVILDLGDLEKIDKLSPSEKYDLLMGNDQSLLTDSMWREGKSYFDRFGKVEKWMGLCHGWAAASYKLPRPENVVKVVTANGNRRINFYPSDIKSLATLLWARARTPVYNLGGRCNSKNPPQDENGRILDSECFDTNPSTWHLSVVNRIGIQKKSFILDAIYDYEVWNQPIVSYSYTYFNPKTKEPVSNLKEAYVKHSDFNEDIFKKYRGTQSLGVVGIAMKVTYLVETDPTQRPTDNSQYDLSRNVVYMYDLEIGKDGQILGGEWYQNLHPDFIWTPTQEARAMTMGDRYIPQSWEWNPNEPLPDQLREIGRYISQRGMPLGRIVEGFIRMSRNR